MANETITTNIQDGVTSSEVDPKDSTNNELNLSTKQQVSNTPVLIFSKTIVADSGYYYSVDPSLEIVSEYPERYSVKVKNKEFTNNVYLSSLTIEVYFLFTNNSIKKSDGDKITVISSPKIIPVRKQEKVNRITIEGGDMPSRGGYRMIKAYGDPGTTMDIIVEDSSGQFYDFNTMTFGSTAAPKRIMIPDETMFPPDELGSRHLGIYQEEIYIPRDFGVSKTTYTASATPAEGYKVKTIEELGRIENVKVEEAKATEDQSVYITFSATQSDGETSRTFAYSGEDTLTVGPFSARQNIESGGEITYPGDRAEFIITVTRTSGSGAFDAVGAPLFSHWSNTSSDANGGWEFSISHEVLTTTATTYEVLVAGQITKAGDASLSTELNFSNFLNYAS